MREKDLNSNFVIGQETTCPKVKSSMQTKTNAYSNKKLNESYTNSKIRWKLIFKF